MKEALKYMDTQASSSKLKEYLSLAKSLFFAFLIAMTFRTFLYEPFHIPSGSMKPTLEIGDYIFVSKYSYGYSKFSFPLALAPIKGRFAQQSEPKRGDVIVFRLPADTSTNYIKRLVGLPGDKIQVLDGFLHINGKMVSKKYYGVYRDRNGTSINRYTETLPEGSTYPVLDQSTTPADNTDVYTVPEDQYFFMGDNRDNSTDSRFLHEVGFIPKENLVGRAEITLWPEGFSKFWVLYQRIGIPVEEGK